MKKMLAILTILTALTVALTLTRDDPRTTGPGAGSMTTDAAPDVVESERRAVVREIDIPETVLDVSVPAEISIRTNALLQPRDIEVELTDLDLPLG